MLTHNLSTPWTHLKNYFSGTQATQGGRRQVVGSHDDHDNFDGSPHSSWAPPTSNEPLEASLNKGGIDGIKLHGMESTQQ